MEMNKRFNGKKVLVTGGAGFIGSNIVDALIEEGCEKVRVFDNFSTGKRENLEHQHEALKSGVLEIMEGDLINRDECEKAVKGMDMVCHQGALGSVPKSIDYPDNTHTSNVDGTFNITMAAKDAGIKRLVFASSSSVYGDDDRLPKIEGQEGFCINPYAASKRIGEVYLETFTKTWDMECICLRYFNIFGARQDPNGAYAAAVPKFVSGIMSGGPVSIFGDGQFSRDFTHVDNAVEANLLALTTTNKEAFGQSMNIGINGAVKIVDLWYEICKHLNIKREPTFSPVRKGDVPHSNATITKAKRLIGYEPITYFEEGMKKTIDWYISK